jgi:phosphatidylglycerol:prolipoprotein diacylglycerol transferase
MLYSALVLLGAFAVLWMLRRRPVPSGTLFGLCLLLAGLERFFVELLRAKDDRLLWGFTTAQAIAAVAVVGGVTLLAVGTSRKHRVQTIERRSAAVGG